MNHLLILSAVISAGLAITAVITIPNPFNYIIALAICGPLSASLLGLKNKQRIQ